MAADPPPRSEPTKVVLPAQRQSPSHSAHIGQAVEVHYRWHALDGRRVRRQRSEQRVAGRVVYVEAAPGVVTVVASWMLDPVACAGMAFGAPRVAVWAWMSWITC